MKNIIYIFKLISLIKDLGLISIIRVGLYRIKIKFKLHRVLFINADLLNEDIYNPSKVLNKKAPKVQSWLNKNFTNSYLNIKFRQKPPDWFYQVFTKKVSKKNSIHWSKIQDFDPDLGDIKPLWDLSRFDWIIPLSQQSSKGDLEALKILNYWLLDWQKKNKPYLGVNWKCGQEASIRVIHLVMGLLILNQLNNPSKAFIKLIIAHLKRIEPTISYALGQNNNHGTSEGAALYIGGSLLLKNGYYKGYKFQKIGKKVLENLMNKLIGSNGTFSQYSLNYHRLMLDTICCCELIRNEYKFPKFSSKFYQKVTLATDWLFSIVDYKSGDGPNIGANDGARIIPLTNCSFRDFRPTIQLAMVIFNSKIAYPNGDWNDQFNWLKIDIKNKKFVKPKSLIAKDGGFTILRKQDIFVCFRYPSFNFRPSQNDILHVDFWIDGKNIFRDAGSYSYNSDVKFMKNFGSIKSHNTIQFDFKEPMDKISRFLYSDWIKTNWISNYKNINGNISFGAGYTDKYGSSHKRHIILNEKSLRINDEIKGFKKNAILRWRLIDDSWQINSHQNSIFLKSDSNDISMEIKCSEKIKSFNIEDGYESLYYQHYNNIPVLKVVIEKKCNLITIVKW